MPSLSTLIATGGAFGIFAALTRRPLTALLLCGYLLASVLASSAVMQSYLGLPLTLADVQFFFLDPIDDLKLFFNYPVLGISFLMVISGAVVLLYAGIRWERPQWSSSTTTFTPTLRYGVAALLIGTLTVGFRSTAQPLHGGPVDDRDAYSAFLALRRLELAAHWVQRLNVFFDNRDMMATLPTAHAQSRFPMRAANAPTALGSAPTAAATAQEMPDMLIVLEESTFDPRLIAKCHYPACDSPMFRAPVGSWRTEMSPLLVHTTGGGTWLTEFAFLSGFDWRSFGRGGAYAPVSLAPRLDRSLPKYLHSLGYRTVAFSGVGADFLRARSAYRYYGFDEFYASQDLKLAEDWHAVRDGTIFDKALAILSAHAPSYSDVPAPADKRPLFVFILTIRNHGPHGDTARTLLPLVKTVEEQLGRPLADYLSRLDDSARDLARLRQSWLDSPRHRVIGWFGDHQPEVAWDFLNTMSDVDPSHFATNANPQRIRYLTYHQLSANFGTPGVVTNQAALDVPYLATELLDFSGVPLDEGMRAANEISIHCHRLLLDCPDHAWVNDYLSYRIHELKSLH